MTGYHTQAWPENDPSGNWGLKIFRKSMTSFTTPLIGRFGNKLFQYAAARALAERDGLGLRVPEWEGEHIFAGVSVTPRPLGGEQVFSGYGQRQEDLLYTRSQVKEWFRWQPWVEEALRQETCPIEVVAHLRHGDYRGYSYPMVSLAAIHRAARSRGYPFPIIVCEERPESGLLLNKWPYLYDFYRLQQAAVLFRGNSSFSWWAATLGEGKVFSPVIEGLEGGVEHDCDFVEGNWPRFSNLPFTTDLHLKP